MPYKSVPRVAHVGVLGGSACATGGARRGFECNSYQQVSSIDTKQALSHSHPLVCISLAPRLTFEVSSKLESLMLTQEGSLMASSFRAVTRQVRWCEGPLAAGLLGMHRYDAGRVVQLLRHYTAGSNINIHTRRGTQRGRAMRRGGTRGRGTRRRAPSRSLLPPQPPHASEPHDPVPSPDPNQYPPQHLPQHQYPTQYPPQQRPVSPFQGRDMFCNPQNFS
ncbi:hypothetical protein J6590_101662 [Homalodisca vitripennis]|nr:hypothetical protein J6590_101662 [Homalodisca vitripennis]